MQKPKHDSSITRSVEPCFLCISDTKDEQDGSMHDMYNCFLSNPSLLSAIMDKLPNKQFEKWMNNSLSAKCSAIKIWIKSTHQTIFLSWAALRPAASSQYYHKSNVNYESYAYDKHYSNS